MRALATTALLCSIQFVQTFSHRCRVIVFILFKIYLDIKSLAIPNMNLVALQYNLTVLNQNSHRRFPKNRPCTMCPDQLHYARC
jgi:hypothetical protein